jgi:hypothetical protein
MSLNIAPVYGKQYIRYAETFEAVTDDDDGGIGVVEIGEFRAVHYATYAGANKVAPGSAFQADPQPSEIVGINQAYIPTALAQPYTARQASVATSGLLLVEVDPAATLTDISLNSQLEIDLEGRAVGVGDGLAVTMNNTKPLIREQIAIGGRKFVLVSFA